MTAIIAGLFTGFSLIVAIGAQNAFVMRQGIRREHVGGVVAICALSDLVLIVAGTLGMGVLITTHPALAKDMTSKGKKRAQLFHPEGRIDALNTFYSRVAGHD